MTTNINQVGSQQSVADSVAGSKKAGADNKAASNSADKPSEPDEPTARETLTVTAEATKLLHLEQEIAATSAIDSQKVDRVRMQLDAGTYQIDSKAIARNLIDSEQELF